MHYPKTVSSNSFNLSFVIHGTLTPNIQEACLIHLIHIFTKSCVPAAGRSKTLMACDLSNGGSDRGYQFALCVVCKCMLLMV
jgi:hypothetical protein